MLAASSLSRVLPGLGAAFEADHPGIRVVFSFGASSRLRQQVLAGAPADVFVSASSAVMRQVVDAGEVTGPRVIARNAAQVAVYPASAPRVSSLSDLARPGVKVALCQPQVPCGSLAQQVLAEAGLRVTPVTLGLDAASTLASVVSGEVDAAIVYITDVRAAGAGVTAVAIPESSNATTAYEVATIRSSKRAELAREFADLLLSASGQRALTTAGFQPPWTTGTLAEADGNRTRQRRLPPLTGVEDRGAHQDRVRLHGEG